MTHPLLRAPINFDVNAGRRTVHATPVWYQAGDMERAVVFEPGYDSGTRNWGVHGMNMRWLLRGPAGVAQFLIYSGWVPGQIEMLRSEKVHPPMGADVGYHALVEQYEGQGSQGPCEYLDGRECFYDGSGLAASDLLKRFVAEGEPVVWRELQDRYDYLALRSASGGAA